MANKIYVQDYFDYLHDAPLDARENKERNKIRRILNSYKDTYDQQAFIYNRRKTAYCRKEDERMFGIPYNATITPNDFYHQENDYYEPDNNKPDYRKKNKDGTIKKDKYGNDLEYGKFGRSMVNFAHNMKNSKAGKFITFIVTHWIGVLTTLGISIALCLVLLAVTFLGGMTDSVGHTPFVLCGDKEILGLQAIKLPNAEAEQMATSDYAAEAFIAVGKAKGWKPNAIIGALAYTMQEGIGMGTFTYENYYCVNGPAGTLKDKTLNNQQWLTWIHSAETLKRYNEVYYAANTKRYAAIGVGLWQQTDTHNTATGPMESSGATQLIEAADAAGKPWQDPEWQLTYLFDIIMSQKTGDSDYLDPTTYTGSAEEYCRRITAFVGMPGWTYTKNNSYMQDHVKHVPEAQNIFENATGIELSGLSQGNGINLCEGANSVITGGNATLADAAVSLASGTDKIPWDMDGLNSPNLNKQELATYKRVHEAIFPGDQYFASCDRSVATAVRWAGADDDFPKGATSQQYSYLTGSDKWTYIGDYGSCDLQPGDVLITKGNGHIKMYVGNEAIKKRFPESNGDMYAGSFHDYFPRVYKDDPSYDSRPYAVFRCTKPDNSETYKNA